MKDSIVDRKIAHAVRGYGVGHIMRNVAMTAGLLIRRHRAYCRKETYQYEE